MTQRPTVYVIDDEDAVRDSIRMLLEITGFTVRAYASGAAFLREVPLESNCCLLVDLNMPGLSGLDLLDQLRQRGMTIPAIVMTGRFNPTVRAHVERAGAQLLEKPFPARELMGRIEEALGPYKA